ncbi:SH3 domain-containing protein [Nitratireductor sp. ZSWI3]|uniref:SH3 domain-containing protein n=1 Tax=Nitratireductor sp. ZSWI3 TaxID=2966359 RepID=UPI00214F9FAD|nr:SH3 domain-containing protein [Nitratireductor sp. ZSWI3]MCR4265318.1 SH3 domain-containing protein [Nitratireductor sp. ZSWI3]
MKKSGSLLAAALLTVLAVGHAEATAFSAWRVTGVGWGDTLNVRKYPASHSQKQTAYPNGTVLQMTGRCTGGVDLLEISGHPAWRQKQAVRYRWCEVWHDPARDGHFVTGWVYGKYIEPAD